jgi:hypothetical protein
VPPETTEIKPVKSETNPTSTDKKTDPEKPLPSSGITLNRVSSFQNGELKSYGFLSPEVFKLRADYDFINGNTLGAFSNFKFVPSGLNLQEYGVNGAFNFAERSRATASLDVNRPEQTITGKLGVVNKDNIYNLGAQLNTANGALNSLNADAAVKFSNTVKADGSVVYDGIGKTVTGKASVTEKENVYNAGVQVNTTNGVVNNANLDAAIKFSNTVKADGSVVYDGIGKTVTGKASVTEKENVYNAGVQVNTINGVVNNANVDAAVKFSNTVKADGSVVYDGIGKTVTGKGSVTEKENVYNGGVQVNTTNGEVNNANLDAAIKFSNTVKADGSIVYDGIGKTVTGKGSVTEKENVYNLNGQLNTETGRVNYLNGDALVHFGKDVKGTGSLAYDGIEETLTGKANLSKKENTYNVESQINTATGEINRADINGAVKFSDTVKGSGSLVYDGIGKTLTGNASVTEKENIYTVGGQLNTANREINNLNADATVKFSDTVKGSGSLIYDGIGKTFTGNLSLNEKDNIYKLGGQINTATGGVNNFNLDTTLKFSDSLKGTGSVVYDGLGQTLTGKASLTDRQNVYTVGGQINTLNGTVSNLNADAAVMFSSTLKSTGSLSYDGIGKSLTAAVGVTDRQNTYNLSTQFNTGTGGFNNIAADANIGFAKGAGSFTLAGKASAQLAELGAGVNYTSNNLNYSGQVKLNNESGAFRFAEASAKISTMSERNGNFSFEAGYRPNDAFVKVGYTFNFGGGGGSSKKSAPSEGFNPVLMERQLDAEVGSFRDKQAIALLKPDDKKLYDQAKVGVEKLNAQGAGLNVERTALFAVANVPSDNGKRAEKIEVEIGSPAKGGQTLIVGNGNLRDPGTEKTAFNPQTASNTPIAESTSKLQDQNRLLQNTVPAPSLENLSKAPKGVGH